LLQILASSKSQTGFWIGRRITRMGSILRSCQTHWTWSWEMIWSVWRRFGNFLFAMFLYKLIYMGSSAFTENMFSSLDFLNYLVIHIIICFCHVELKLFLVFSSFSSFVCDEVVQNFRQELDFPWLFPGLAEWVLTLVQWLFTWKNKFPVEIGPFDTLR